MAKEAILLLAHGTPENLEDVPAYLKNVVSGRPMSDEVVKEIQHRYSLIGRSPLTELTYKQAESVSRESGLPVYVGMRNWKPYIHQTVQQMADEGVTHAVAICMAPHQSRTSVGLYKRAVLGETGREPFTVDFVDDWHAHPGLIAAFAERFGPSYYRAVQQAGRQLPTIFTAHSVPAKTIADGDPYEQQAKEAASLLASRLGLTPHEWTFAFQSQGMSGGAWIGPTVEETMTALHMKGAAGVFIQPVGFLCDHVEILYDIDIAFREFATSLDMRLWRAESLNDSPTLARAITDLARQRLTSTAGMRG
jgi:ferrochelatase